MTPSSCHMKQHYKIKHPLNLKFLLVNLSSQLPHILIDIKSTWLLTASEINIVALLIFKRVCVYTHTSICLDQGFSNLSWSTLNAVHFCRSPLSDTPNSSLAVCNNEQRSWIWCVRCAVLGLLQDSLEKHWFRSINLKVFTC